MRVSIIGRSNVGKSTIFNRLTGKKKSIIKNIYGVTRDRIEDTVMIDGKNITFVDTAGFDNAKDKMSKMAMEQSKKALSSVDLILFVVDARDIDNPYDAKVADIVRKSKKKAYIIANKCDNSAISEGTSILQKYGFGEPLIVSAEHNIGIYDIKKKILENYIENDDTEFSASDMKITFIGRPNVGKSSLINALLEDDRLVTSDEAGTTRDSVSIDYFYMGKKLKLIDTAGLRKKAKITDALEKASSIMSNNELRFSEVAVLVISAENLFEKQDLTLARKIIEEGRILIIAVNKWDLVENPNKTKNKIRDILDNSLSQLDDVSIIYTSALKKRGIDEIINSAFTAYEKWNKRIPTAKLNQFFNEITATVPPPLSQNNRTVKLKYITQARIRPPTFTVFSGNREKPPESYQKYLLKAIRKMFGFSGIPVRINVKAPKNPYE